VKDRFYRILTVLSKGLGLWLFRLVAWGIASGYFFLFPSRVAVSTRFYRALFPARSGAYHLFCTWKQFHRFTHVFLDRLLPDEDYPLEIVRDGAAHLEQAIEEKGGGILLMSHLGNWELAAQMLLKLYGGVYPDMKLLLYLGRKHKEQIEGRQKQELAARGIEIVAVAPDGASPADLVDGIHFLKKGGLVSMTGDRRWWEEQRYVPVRFLGHEARLPEAPFVLSLLSGTPIYIFFAYREARRTYRLRILPPLHLKTAQRSDRQNVIRRAAQVYADHLEEMVREAPFEWFHFEPFLGRELS
jgi:predicted LPLAT superfamily acyltransferase